MVGEGVCTRGRLVQLMEVEGIRGRRVVECIRMRVMWVVARAVVVGVVGVRDRGMILVIAASGCVSGWMVRWKTGGREYRVVCVETLGMLGWLVAVFMQRGVRFG